MCLGLNRRTKKEFFRSPREGEEARKEEEEEEEGRWEKELGEKKRNSIEGWNWKADSTRKIKDCC